MNDITLTRDDLKVKIQSFEVEIKNLTNQIDHLKRQADNLRYLHENFNSIAGVAANIDRHQASLPFHTPLDPSLDTKRLLLVILKNENRKMTWGEIFNIFKRIKPAIAESTVRVSLSQMNKSGDYPVKLIQEGSDFRYVYEEKN